MKPLAAIENLYVRFVYSGKTDGMSRHELYKLVSINKFCLICICITLPYYYLFIIHKLYGPVMLFLTAHILFGSIIYLNHSKKYNEANLLLIFTTFSSVLVISFMLGFESGFHLYLYTAPLFIFWLFNLHQLIKIIAAFGVYILLYLLVYLYGKSITPAYVISFSFMDFDLYSINMLTSLCLTFIIFYSYTYYYRILTTELVKQQTELKEEVEKRRISEDRIQTLYSELNVSYKNLEQFSHVVSHNLKAPLYNIKGYLDLYESEENDPALNTKIMESLRKSANVLEDVIGDLGTILRFKNHLPEKKEHIRLKELMDEVLHSLNSHIHEAGVQIDCFFDQALVVNTYKPLLRSVLFNLISNAIKYRRTDVSPFINIYCESGNGEYFFKIVDNGLGIDLEKYGNRIFNIYSRFHIEKEGKGIGLYLVKTQVELMRGKITVESSPGKGSTFKFTIL